MKRRCFFLDNLPAYNFNGGRGEYIRDSDGNIVLDDNGEKMCYDTTQLGSILMNAMLREVKDFCDPEVKNNWFHPQVTEYQQHCKLTVEKLMWVVYKHNLVLACI